MAEDAPSVDDIKALVRVLRGTRQEAVDAAIKESLDRYRTGSGAKGKQFDDTEYGTALLVCADGTFQYSEPNAGPKGGAWETRLKMPAGCKVDSIIHTHPPDSYGYAGLSPHDMNVAEALKGVTSYVVTPGARPTDKTQIHERRPDGSVWADGEKQSVMRNRRR